MLKQSAWYCFAHRNGQPPSGGCVLKRLKFGVVFAAFPSRLQAAVC
ncbi:hypothetical protein [Neisseria mucosa]